MQGDRDRDRDRDRDKKRKRDDDDDDEPSKKVADQKQRIQHIVVNEILFGRLLCLCLQERFKRNLQRHRTRFWISGTRSPEERRFEGNYDDENVTVSELKGNKPAFSMRLFEVKNEEDV